MESILPFLFPILGISFFAFVIFILSRVGWHAFTHLYSTLDKPKGKSISFVSARIGVVNYNSTLGVIYNEEGLYLHPELVFKLFHKPLFIPWEDIHYQGETSIFIASYAKLAIGHPEIGVIRIQMRAFEKFKKFLYQDI